ncbi:UNVERIFIED_CONTAM: kefBC [Trichonephila clavipes]
MAAEGGSNLVQVVTLLGAAVVFVPLFRRLGLGSVLGYLTAGLLIGPFGIGLFSDAQAILHLAELGVIMFLFVIGLEMQPSHLWSLRRHIFGLGALQIGLSSLALTGIGHWLLGFSWPVAFIGATGFVLTSTAIVMQLLGERGDIARPNGQKIVAVLLFEDLLIVPLLAIVAFMAPAGSGEAAGSGASGWQAVGIAAAALAGLVAAGIWLLNPLFRMLARAGAREVMTAAALLVVLGAALLMELGGLSMAMGAFLAGVLLSGSTFRHQLEADVEPFRGLLLGLFFLAVGMSLNLPVVADNAGLIIIGVLAMMLVKALCIYIVARLTRSGHHEALDRATLMAQGGEFAFVLFATALAAGVIDPQANANLTAIVVLSMALTPLVGIAMRPLLRSATASMDGIEAADDLHGSVLLIGFGRVGQIVGQNILARGCDISVIETSTETIRNAADYGFKVYYGDGSRLDVLHAAGAGSARAIVVCIDDAEAATRIVHLVSAQFPQARLLVRAHDRLHALDLVAAGVDTPVRETFEAAMQLGHATLLALGLEPEEADAIGEDVRRRDAERFTLQQTGDMYSGSDLMHGNGSGHLNS